jgi:hypothetical protein
MTQRALAAVPLLLAAALAAGCNNAATGSNNASASNEPGVPKGTTQTGQRATEVIPTDAPKGTNSPGQPDAAAAAAAADVAASGASPQATAGASRP